MEDVNNYVKYYELEGQKEGEDDTAYRHRIAGELRDMGKIIEAHEVYHGKRWDSEDGADVMTGITGATAQALHDVDYGRAGQRQIDDDFAAGVVALNPRPKMTPEMVVMMLELFGKG
jgi:hypothetical protein